MFACLHPALEDKTVGSVNANIGAESISGGKTTSAASRNFPKFPNHFNIAKYSFLINNSFTNNFKDIFALRYRIFFFFFFFSFSFRSQSTSSDKCSWPGSEFIRWHTRLSYAGVLAFDLL